MATVTSGEGPREQQYSSVHSMSTEYLYTHYEGKEEKAETVNKFCESLCNPEMAKLWKKREETVAIFSYSASLIPKGQNEQNWPYGHLVTRATIVSGKVEIIDINGPFIDLTSMFYISQYDLTHGKFNGTVKAENRKLVINQKAITIF
ncbi:hypothetical protein STEG23_018526 [Scotinomys teguina]